MKRLAIAMAAICTLLAACSSGPVRRVSEPAVNIQQLTVHADGRWSVDLRINNFSSIPMRFDRASFAMTLGGQAAGTLQGPMSLTIGPEAADVATLSLAPTPAASMGIADTLARGGSVGYTLEGTLEAGAEKGGLRTYELKRTNTLSAMPGLPGVLR